MRDSATRKGQPIALGVVAYFGPALSAVDDLIKSGGASPDGVTLETIRAALDDVSKLPVLAAATLAMLEVALRRADTLTLQVAPGVFMFSHALAAVAEVSRRGNEKHNPGEPLHWAREKSTDEADAYVRHIVDSFEFGPLALDDAGNPNLGAAAWRVLAWLTRVIEGDNRWRNPM
jgi:hypothetical protein